MHELSRLDPAAFVDALSAVATAATAHARGIDGLSAPAAVGTDAADLAASVARSAAEVERPTFPKLAGAMAGACRTSSGAMLATAAPFPEFFVAVADVVRNADAIDAERLAVALEAGCEAFSTDSVVAQVCAAAAASSLSLADSGAPLVDTLIAGAEAGLDALEAHAAAGESGVDPASAVLLVWIDALVAFVAGEDPEVPAWEFDDSEGDNDLADGRYRVALRLVSGDDAAAERLGVLWRSVGDAVEISAAVEPEEVSSSVPPSGRTWRAVVWTDDIGGAIELALQCGTPSQIVVTDRDG